MIERFEAAGAYDVVLIDARAGLHETTPAAILGLGAEVLLFGIDQPQTFLGYRLLMAHLARFPVDPEDDWRERLNFVHARASDNKAACAAARERFHGLYDLVAPRSATQNEDESEPLSAQDFDMEWDDSGGDETGEELFTPPPVLHILDDRRYADFDPISDRTLLASRTCAVTFESLIAYAERLVIDPESESL
jgi:hypothetical protein